MKRKIYGKAVLSLALVSTTFMPATIMAKDTDKENEKEETVYVVNDASGNSEDVIVSGWLKNNTNAKELIDQCNLKDVVNVKGKQTFTSKDGVNTWNAKGKDIYYQGSATQEVPVKVKVSYTLDGKEISATDLLNKSGKVSIHVQYTNNTKVNYEGKEYSVPMLMATGMVLDSNKFSNVTIDNGKVINDGSRYIIAGFGVPGLNESLGIKEEIIPSSFTINANVKKFSTSEMITYAGNDMLNELDLKNVNTADELMGAINQLGNASTQLVNGSSSLADGIATLANKSTSLVNGVKDINTGSLTLANNLVTLKDGLATAKDGSAKLVSGLTMVSGGIDQLMASREAVANGLTQLSAGMDKANAALTQSITYNNLVDQYLKGLQTNMSSIMSEEQKAELAKVIQANQGSIQYQQAVQASLSGASTEGTLKNGLAKLQAAMAASGDNSFGAGLTILKGALNATMENNGQSGLIEGMKTLQAGIESAYNGSVLLSEGANTLSAGTTTLNNASGQLVNGISELNTGSQTLKAGMAEFDATGIQKLVNVFNGDVKALTSKLQTLIKADKEYQSFSGLSTDMNGSVKYVIKTAGIE